MCKEFFLIFIFLVKSPQAANCITGNSKVVSDNYRYFYRKFHSAAEIKAVIIKSGRYKFADYEELGRGFNFFPRFNNN